MVLQHSGHLWKKGQGTKGYVKRYCELTADGCLSYRKSRKDSTVVIKLQLAGSKVVDDSSMHEHGFTITGGLLPREYRFAGYSHHSKMDWMVKLGTACSVSPTTVHSDLPSQCYSKEKHRVTLADFTVLKVIGQGTFGKVVKVRLRRTGEEFAMKVMKKSKVRADKVVKNTLAEKRIMQQLNHPYICKLHYAFQTKERLYLVLDLLSKGELFDQLSALNRFEEDRARMYAAQIASALTYIHKQDIAYRDLKPENVVLDKDGHACITDFGIAKSNLKPRTRTNTFCGTPEYLAPELVAKRGHWQAVDWWALGVMLYEMLYGVAPFYDDDAHEMYRQIKEDEPQFPSDEECEEHGLVPPSTAAKDLISKLLDKNENTRLQEGDDILRHPFFASINMQKLLRRELPAPEPAPKLAAE